MPGGRPWVNAPMVLLVVSSANAPAWLMAAATSIMMSLTHYASGSSPVIYGSGYVSMNEWWKAGFIMSVIELVIFSTIGAAWWKVLGYW